MGSTAVKELGITRWRVAALAIAILMALGLLSGTYALERSLPAGIVRLLEHRENGGGQQNGNDHDSSVSETARENHGQEVAQTARENHGQEEAEVARENHGQQVSETARDNHGQRVSAIAKSKAD
jgi:hypothetical protein